MKEALYFMVATNPQIKKMFFISLKDICAVNIALVKRESHLSTMPCEPHITLTRLLLDKKAAISQPTFSNAFSGMKMHGFRLIFH